MILYQNESLMRYLFVVGYLLCWFCGQYTFAQCPQFARLMREVDVALSSEDYEVTLTKLEAARAHCPEKGNIVNQKTRAVFLSIERQKEEAQRAKERADSARYYIQQERDVAIKAKKLAETEKRKADSLLNLANNLLSKLYFYQGKYGLTLKRVGYRPNFKYRYGYIDQQGNEVIPFEFEEATPFSLGDGFARVVKDRRKCLLDTTGRVYYVANSLAELRKDTEVLILDIYERSDEFMPEDADYSYEDEEDWLIDSIAQYSDLKILQMGGEGIDAQGRLFDIPASFGKLTELMEADLSYNRIFSFPPEIRYLTKLEELTLYGNPNTSFPPEMEELSSLRRLTISGDDDEEFSQRWPEGLTHLTQLKELEIDYFLLDNIPAELGNMRGLTKLTINECNLRKIPSEISQLSQLKYLSLAYNQLADLPSQIGQLSQLTELYLSMNELSELPEALGALSTLEKLDLSFNELTTIPASFAELTKLKELDLTNNQVDSLTLALHQTLNHIPFIKVDQNPIRYIHAAWYPHLGNIELADYADECYIKGAYQQAYRVMNSLCKRSNSYRYWQKKSLYACFVMKMEEAISTAKQAVKDHPEQRGLPLYLALAYFFNGQYEVAANVIQEWKDGESEKDEEKIVTAFLLDVRRLEVNGNILHDYDKLRSMIEP